MLEQLVARFGGMSSDEIAEFLCAHGCFGSHLCSACPLARYFSREMGQEVRVGVVYIQIIGLPVRTPVSIWGFLISYDKIRCYPFLEIA